MTIDPSRAAEATTVALTPTVDHGENCDADFDAKAVIMVRLINKLDHGILALRTLVPPSKPWQRNLLAALDDADRQMQVLRIMEAMEKSDRLIAESTVALSKACRRVQTAIGGSRADGMVRGAAMAITKSGDALCRLVLDAVPLAPGGAASQP